MSLLLSVDAGRPFVAIAGIHAGCFELFGTSRVRSLLDLKNGTIAVGWAGGLALVTAMATYVGFDPRREAKLIQPPSKEAIQLLADGKIDALLGFPPDPQELRTRKIGHVVVSTTTDRPWSQYFCCMAVTNVNFAKKHPAATKRMLRAFAKATDMCALDPDRVARSLVDRGFVKDHAYALQTLKEVPYARWREYDPADTMRFYALRLHETGMIKTSPAEDPRPEHRLALLQGVEEGAEGIAGRALPTPDGRSSRSDWRFILNTARLSKNLDRGAGS